ncbi:MAG: hypothetical protein KF752_15165 [Pirellulaceae bacterium]|nr:hypothetical protein [Pirellulaceae bacterium]
MERKPAVFSRPIRVLMLCLAGGGVLPAATGCNVFTGKKQLQQLETENNRLLSEYRAERQRRETAERTAQQLEVRLAESEKLLARQIQDSATSRLSSLPDMLRSDLSAPSLSSPQRDSEGTSSGLRTPSEFRWQRRTN